MKCEDEKDMCLFPVNVAYNLDQFECVPISWMCQGSFARRETDPLVRRHARGKDQDVGAEHHLVPDATSHGPAELEPRTPWQCASARRRRQDAGRAWLLITRASARKSATRRLPRSGERGSRPLQGVHRIPRRADRRVARRGPRRSGQQGPGHNDLVVTTRGAAIARP